MGMYARQSPWQGSRCVSGSAELGRPSESLRDPYSPRRDRLVEGDGRGREPRPQPRVRPEKGGGLHAAHGRRRRPGAPPPARRCSTSTWVTTHRLPFGQPAGDSRGHSAGESGHGRAGLGCPQDPAPAGVAYRGSGRGPERGGEGVSSTSRDERRRRRGAALARPMASPGGDGQAGTAHRRQGWRAWPAPAPAASRDGGAAADARIGPA
jgi:hypothetical protein